MRKDYGRSFNEMPVYCALYTADDTANPATQSADQFSTVVIAVTVFMSVISLSVAIVCVKRGSRRGGEQVVRQAVLLDADNRASADGHDYDEIPDNLVVDHMPLVAVHLTRHCHAPRKTPLPDGYLHPSPSLPERINTAHESSTSDHLQSTSDNTQATSGDTDYTWGTDNAQSTSGNAQPTPDYTEASSVYTEVSSVYTEAASVNIHPTSVNTQTTSEYTQLTSNYIPASSEYTQLS